MEYMGTKEAAEKWSYTQATISKWCRQGKIYLVVKPEKRGGQWQIPVNAECPKQGKGKKPL